ncbi:MAG TPA: molybdopterin cofactor-binding domain-containing protein, partial [Vicinamibacteria bacterium]|nr:molybdopterin cofactor-binding domain-containing protein [Vicinamibacteria bacterium]
MGARSRREFLVASGLAGAALVLPIAVRGGASGPEVLAPSLWLGVHPDGRIVFAGTKLEMGQGILTALAVLVAEELEVDPSAIDVRFPSTDELAGRERLLETSSSSSVTKSWRPVRLAAAGAREMLVAAAARSWGAPPAECRAESAGVTHLPSGRRLTYGALASAAARETAPKLPRLKKPPEFRRIGRPASRMEGADIVRGRIRFGCDERREGMLYAALARPPLRGARLRPCDPAPALAVPGVKHVVKVGESVAVVAETTWDALQGRAALAPAWDGGEGADFSSDGFDRLLRQGLDAPSAASYDPERKELRASSVLATGEAPPWPPVESGLVAEYATPFQAHATMEPPNAVGQVCDGRHEVWCGTQFPGEAVQEIARRFGVPRASVVVHPMQMGGGFGRREVPDY